VVAEVSHGGQQYRSCVGSIIAGCWFLAYVAILVTHLSRVCLTLIPSGFDPNPERSRGTSRTTDLGSSSNIARGKSAIMEETTGVSHAVFRKENI
jgi:hypothetical protein